MSYANIVQFLTAGDDGNFELGLNLIVSTVRKERHSDVLRALGMSIANSYYKLMMNKFGDISEKSFPVDINGFSVSIDNIYGVYTSSGIPEKVAKIILYREFSDDNGLIYKKLKIEFFINVHHAKNISERSTPGIQISFYESNYFITWETDFDPMLNKWAKILLKGIKCKIP